MTAAELKKIEAELERRGYRKFTHALTCNESWAWFKAFGKEKDEDGHVVNGYHIAFRVWDYTKCEYAYEDYGFDFWTSEIGVDGRIDHESSWRPICDIDTFERMAEELHRLVRKYVTTSKTDKDGK